MGCIVEQQLQPPPVLVLAGGAIAQTDRPGTEEFGLTRKELVQAIEKVEALIAQCMRNKDSSTSPRIS